MVTHRFSGDYLPYLDVLVNMMNSMDFRLLRNRILFRTIDPSRVSLLEFEVRSSGEEFRDSIHIDGYDHGDDLKRIINYLGLARVKLIEFTLDGDDLIISGSGDYSVSRRLCIDEGYWLESPPDPFNEAYGEVSFRDISRLRNICSTLRDYDRVIFRVEGNKLRLIGKSSDKEIEVAYPINESINSNPDVSVYPSKFVKFINYVIRRVKPKNIYSIKITWSANKPLKIVFTTNLVKQLKYYVAPATTDL